MPPTLRAKLTRNTAATYGSTFLQMAIGFLLTPFLLHKLGNTYYGIWELIGSVIGYFLLLDLGLSAALSKYVAEYHAQHRDSELSMLCGTVFAVYLVLGVIAFVLVLVFSPWFAQVFHIPPQDVKIATWVFVLSGFEFFILLPTSLFNAILVGYQRIDQLAFAGSLALLIDTGLTVLVLSLGFSLVAVAIVSITTTINLALLRLFFIKRSAPDLRFSPFLFHKEVARSIFGYSIAVFGVQLASMVLFRSDNVILGLFYPVSIIATYAVTIKLANILRQLSFPLGTALFPAYAEMHGIKDEARLRRLFLEGTKGMNLMGIMISVFIIIAGIDVLVLWVGPEYRRQGPVLYTMVIFAYLFAVASVSSRYLIGTGQARARAYIAIPDLLANLTLCILFTYLWGQFGVALGNLVSLFMVECLIMIPFSCRKLGIPLKQYFEASLLPALWPALLMSAYLIIFRLTLPITNWPIAFFSFGSSTLVFGTAFLVFVASQKERRTYWLAIRDLFHLNPDSEL